MVTQPNVPAGRVEFGPFEFDPVSGDLRKFGTRIRLQGKPLQILGLLLERTGDLVSRDELQRHLWSGTTFVDFEQGLNAAVNKLRQALGDSADQPRYVETLPGRGYRFIAPVQRVPKALIELALPRAVPAARVRYRAWLPIGGVAAVAVAALTGYLVGTRASGNVASLQPVRFKVMPPPGFALEGGAARQSLALSPDGSRLAFSAVDSTGQLSLFVRDLNSLDPQLVPDSQGSNTMFWPPDGQSLFFTARGKLRRAGLAGGPAAVLSDAPYAFSGAWLSPQRLIMSDRMNTSMVSPSGGSLERIRDVYSWPQSLPGGKLLYVVWDAEKGRYRIRIGSFGEPASARDILEADSRALYTASVLNPGAGYLLFVRGGSLLAHPFDLESLRLTGEAAPIVSNLYWFLPTGAADFSVSDRGTLAYRNLASRSQLVWVDRHGRQLSTVGPANANVKFGRLSPDGRQVAAAFYEVERGAQSLWVFDTATGTGRRLTLARGVRDSPVWSPDSSRLAYLFSKGDRPPVIHVRGIGNDDSEQPMPSMGFQVPTDWSPDGRFISYVDTGFPRTPNGSPCDLWLVDVSGDRKPIPLLNSSFHEANPAFSPDGKWLAFTSNESGQPELYIQAFEATGSPRVTGERYLVSRAGVQAVRWRRDGREIYYLALDGRVHAVPVTLGGKPTFGQAQALFPISREALSAIHANVGFDASPDGQRFLIPMVSSAEGTSLVIVQNWEAALARRQAGAVP